MSNLNDIIDQFLELICEPTRRGQAPRSGFDIDKIIDEDLMFSMSKYESDLYKYISLNFNKVRRTAKVIGTYENNMSLELSYEDLKHIFPNKTRFYNAIDFFVKHALLIQKKPRSTIYFFNPFVINNFTDTQNHLLGIKPILRKDQPAQWFDPYLINDKLEQF